MVLEGNVHTRRSVPLDILSGLPENVIDDILVCLPLRDAVKTSILSKKWRYNWCRLPELILDDTLWGTREDLISPTIGFTNVMYHLLALRSEPIAKFTLSIFYHRICPKIDILIYFLSRNGIQHLVLELPRGDLFTLPSSFYSCTLLRHLTLRNCSMLPPPPTFKGFNRLISLELDDVSISCESIESLLSCSIQHLVLEIPVDHQLELPSSFFTCMLMRHLFLSECSMPLPPPGFKGFDRLISLKLYGVTVSSKLLQSLISDSPLLEQLVLHEISGLSDPIEINAPMLRSFDFTGGMRSIRLKSIPLLVKLSLVGTELYHLRAAGKYDIARFLKSFSALEDLHLNEYSIKFLAESVGEVPTGKPSYLNCFKRLDLSDLSLSDLDVVSCALCLLRSLPYLQFLEIQVGEDLNDIPALQSLEVEAFSDFTFTHLREVKLDTCVGTKPDVQLAKLLLARSPVLVQMSIGVWIREDNDDLATEMVAVINSCQRASSDVEVVYDYSFHYYNMN